MPTEGRPLLPRPRLDRLLHPSAVAVVGATERPGYGQRLLRNLLDGAFRGAVYPVSRSRDLVFGIPAVSSVEEIDSPVDVALVVVPAPAVAEVIRACGRREVAAAVVISSGFGEAGEEGRRHREELQAAAAETGLLVIGPNGNGYACASADVWATTFSGLRPGQRRCVLPAALLSQSGGTAFGAGHERALDLGFTFDAIFSMGNEEVTTSEQLAELLLSGETKVVALVAEELHDGPALLRAARLARERDRFIVVLKIGRSEAGRAAAATHTAALAGDDAVIDGVLRQHGIVRVDDVDELVQCVRYLTTAKPPSGRRAVVLSHSGGLGALAADALGGNGFELPELPAGVLARLDELLPGTGGRANPVDITMALRAPVVSDVVTALAQAEVDLLQVITAGDTALPARVAAGLAAAGTGVPAHLVWASGLRSAEDLTPLDESPIPWFTGAATAAKVLARMREAHRSAAPSRPGGSPELRPAETLDEVAGKRLLTAAGIPVPAAVVTSDPAELRRCAHEVPAPWVLKVASSKVLHKAAEGLLALDLDDDASLAAAVERLDAAAAGLTDRRWLLEEQVDVRAELYLGCTVDPHFGPVVGVGPGGGDVELLHHVVWATCPLESVEAQGLLADDRLRRWLEFRGVGSADRAALAELVARISRWFVTSEDTPQEAEVNPLAVTKHQGRPVVLDAVVRVAGRTAARDGEEP